MVHGSHQVLLVTILMLMVPESQMSLSHIGPISVLDQVIKLLDIKNTQKNNSINIKF